MTFVLTVGTCWLSVALAAKEQHVAASHGSEFQISLLVKRF